MSSSQRLIFIGDVHGQYAALIRLLKKLGFNQGRHGWTHPRYTAVFVGDLIDRGPQSREVVETVRSMVEHGSAYCIMGNHELNAIHFHTPDSSGEYLRKHSEKNIKQHEATLNSYRNDAGALKDTLAWFRTLPVALDWGSVRTVHATWSKDHLGCFVKRDAGYYFADDTQLEQSAHLDTPEFEAVEILLKGAEITLPEGARFRDKSGDFWRTQARLNWWQQTHNTWEEAITVPEWPSGLDPRGRPDLPDEFRPLLYASDAPPVFFGHYWMRGDLALQAHNAFCADYSAGKGDRLCAYAWEGEARLNLAKCQTEPV